MRWGGGLVCISLVLSEHIFLYFLYIFFGETSINPFYIFKSGLFLLLSYGLLITYQTYDLQTFSLILLECLFAFSTLPSVAPKLFGF